MQALRSAPPWQRTLAFSLASLGFFVPFSTAGTAITLAVLLVLLAMRWRGALQLQPWREPVLAVGLVLLAWLFVRTLVAGGGLQVLASTNRYHELLMVPVLWCLLRMAHAPGALFAGFAAGTLALAVLHWFAPLSADVGHWLGMRRISAGFAMSLAAFLMFEHARLGLLPRVAGMLAAAFLAGTVLFATDGRTGHVVLLLLLGCAAWRMSGPRWRWAAAFGLVVMGMLLSVLSEPMRARITETLSVAQATEDGAELTSTNIRVQLFRTGLAVAREHYVVGTGLSEYPAAFAEAAQRVVGRGPWSSGDNPHNEYLMQLGAGGVPALVLFVMWLGLPLLDGRRGGESSPWPGMLACVTAAFAVASLFNSLLLDFVEGHLYAVLLAWLLAQRERTA